MFTQELCFPRFVVVKQLLVLHPIMQLFALTRWKATQSIAFKFASLFILLGITFSGILVYEKPVMAYHRTNRPDVERSLEDGWIVIYFKEFSHAEYLKLVAALVADGTITGGAATSAYLSDFVSESLVTLSVNAAKKLPNLVEQISQDLTFDKFFSNLKLSLTKKKQINLDIAGLNAQIGYATYNRAECVDIFKKPKCIETPNTYQPYIRFRADQVAARSRNAVSQQVMPQEKPAPQGKPQKGPNYPLQGTYFSPDRNQMTFVWWNVNRYTWCDFKDQQLSSAATSEFGHRGNAPVAYLESQGATYWSQPCTNELIGVTTGSGGGSWSGSGGSSTSNQTVISSSPSLILGNPNQRTIDKLRPVPVFTIVNAQGGPLTANPPNGQTGKPVTGVFISRMDAQAFFDDLKIKNPVLAQSLRVTPVSLGEVYKFAQLSQDKPDNPAYAYVPMKQQVDAAINLLRQSGQNINSFNGVPLFVAKGGPDRGYLTIQRGNETIIPIFFKIEELQSVLKKLEQQDPLFSSTIDIQVINLEGLIQTLHNGNSSGLDKIILIAPQESLDYVRSLKSSQ